VYFVFPYFYHDAFMHHPLHVLDAPGLTHVYFFVGVAKVYSQLDGGPWPDFPHLDPPLLYCTVNIGTKEISVVGARFYF